jgi:RNase adaptor protein for sRNA GlmZ degradation
LNNRREHGFLQDQLLKIEESINKEKEKVQPIDREKEDLIAQKAILQFQLAELDKTEVPEILNFDYKIKLLTTAIE